MQYFVFGYLWDYDYLSGRGELVRSFDKLIDAYDYGKKLQFTFDTVDIYDVKKAEIVLSLECNKNYIPEIVRYS